MSSPAGNSPSILEQGTCFSLGTRMVYFSRAPAVDSVGAIRIWPNASEPNARRIAALRKYRFTNSRCIGIVPFDDRVSPYIRSTESLIQVGAQRHSHTAVNARYRAVFLGSAFWPLGRSQG